MSVPQSYFCCTRLLHNSLERDFLSLDSGIWRYLDPGAVCGDISTCASHCFVIYSHEDIRIGSVGLHKRNVMLL